jgi:hypothetical protein
MSREELKLSAQSFGFDLNWIVKILETWGDDVLSLIVEAARNGISVQFIVELLEKFGPVLLQLLVDLLNRKKMMAFAAGAEVVPGPVVEGVEGPFLDLIIEKYLPLIIQKYLPVIMEKYGPQLIQMIIDLFLKNLQK